MARAGRLVRRLAGRLVRRLAALLAALLARGCLSRLGHFVSSSLSAARGRILEAVPGCSPCTVRLVFKRQQVNKVAKKKAIARAQPRRSTRSARGAARSSLLTGLAVGVVVGLIVGLWAGVALEGERTLGDRGEGQETVTRQTAGSGASSSVATWSGSSGSSVSATLASSTSITSASAPFVPPPGATSLASPATSESDAGSGIVTPPGTHARLLSVTDGDTIVVAYAGGGQDRVRLIGIDAPETGEPFSREATRELEAILGSGELVLETDVETRDRYGRLLAYVWVRDEPGPRVPEAGTADIGGGTGAAFAGWVMANLELLRAGVVTLYTVPPNVAYVDELRQAQDEAQAAGRGLWGAPAESPLRILTIRYDAPGNDNFNLNEEYIVFEVLVSGTLAGYAVEDEAGHRYEFPDRVFSKGAEIILHTGVSHDTSTDLYWGMTGSAVWNNTGDTVKVLDPQGHVVVCQGY